MNSLSEHIRSLAQSSTTPQTLIDIAEDVQELEDENARYREALTPSADTKTAFIGEFTFAVERSDSLGSRYSEEQLVPWSTIKEIMGAINRRALNPTSAGDE